MADNLFSFEIRERDASGKLGESLGEYILLNGPVRYSEQYKYRIQTTPTFGGNAKDRADKSASSESKAPGSSTIDYGRDNNLIQLEGEFHIYFLARPADGPSGPSFLSKFDDGEPGLGFGDITAGAKSLYNDASGLIGDFSGTAKKLYDRTIGYATGLIPVPGVGGIRSGEMEFFDFVAIMAGTWEAGSTYQSEDNQASSMLTKFRAKNKPFNYSEFGLVFHDYGRRRHVEVVHSSEGFKVSRSVDDTNTYKWEMTLTVIKDEREDAFTLPSKIERYFNVNYESAIAELMVDIKDLISLPTVLSGGYLRMSRVFRQISTTGSELSGAWDNMRKVFASDGKFAAINFNEGYANIGRGFQEEPEQISLAQKARDAQAEFQRRLRDLYFELSQAMNDLSVLLISPSVPLQSYAALPESNFEPLIGSPYYPQILEAQIAVINLQSYIRQAATDNQYIIHKAIGGDSWEALAKKYLGDPDLASALAAYNKKQRAAGIVGRSIKIPFGHKLAIYAQLPDNPSDADIEKGLMGEDLALTDERDFAVAANGDLDVVEGDPALMNNVIDMVDTPEGALPMYPDYGNPAVIGEVPETFLKDRFVDRLLAKIETDPRVKSARVSGVRQDGREFIYFVAVESNNGSETFFLDV